MRRNLLIIAIFSASTLIVGACVERAPELSPADRERIAEFITREAPDVEHELSVEFEHGVELIGYRVQQGGEDVDEIALGEPVTLTWYWHATEDISDDYKLFTHAVDGTGANRENLDTNGALRNGDTYQPGRWGEGEYLRDVQEITLDAATWNSDRLVLYLGIYNDEGRLGISRGSNDGDDRVRALGIDVAAAVAPPPPVRPPPSMIVARATDITIDGEIEEASWQAATPASAFVNTMNGEAGQVNVVTRTLWDDSRLYISFVVEDTFLTAPHTERDAALYEHDCVEMMIDPDGDGRNYFELQVSPTGVIFDTRYDSRRQPEGGHADWDSEMRVAVSVRGTANDDEADQGYTVELSLPWNAFEVGEPPATRPEPNGEWRLNFYAFDKQQDGAQLSAGWSPTHVGDFHVPARFGTLRFAPPPEPEPEEAAADPTLGNGVLDTPRAQLDPAALRAFRQQMLRSGNQGNQQPPSELRIPEGVAQP